MPSLRTKYFWNMKDIEVMSLMELCDDLNIDQDIDTFPCEAMNRVTAALAKKYRDTDLVTLLLVDEVIACNGLQTITDWRDLEVRKNIILLMGLSPRAYFATSTKVLPPQNESVLTRPLVYKHRNCPQIRNLSRPLILIFILFVLWTII